MKFTLLFILLTVGFGHQSQAQTLPQSPEELQVQINDFNQKLNKFIQTMNQMQTQKPNEELMKKFLGYFQLSDTEKAKYDEMWTVAKKLTSYEWAQLMGEAYASGNAAALMALNQAAEETTLPQALALPAALLKFTFPDETEENFLNTTQGLIYSKTLKQTTSTKSSPVIVGGGFPFNQSQFKTFNAKLAEQSDVELYDPICNGMSVLFDAIYNSGETCKPYEAQTPMKLLKDELSHGMAYSSLSNVFLTMPLTLKQKQKILFRISRMSFKGLSLPDQANGLKMMADQKGYGEGEAIIVGLSYGGLIATKTAALYPGKFKSIVLFSPGISNATHSEEMAAFSSIFEGTSTYRSAVKKIVRDVAFSPRYDVYVPTILTHHNEAFRNSLQKKMLGELDMDITTDLARLQDRVFMISGGKDAAVPFKTQIEAMKTVFRKNSSLGTYILIPEGGHALWGNPLESSEDAVLAIMSEIQKGEAGALLAEHSYVWDGETKSFKDMGTGLASLARVQLFIESMNTQSNLLKN